MFDIHHESVKRHQRQKASVLLWYMPFALRFEEFYEGASQQLCKSEIANTRRSNARQNVRCAKKTLRQGGKFLHECRSRKGRYSLNCAVMRRSADKEPHVNILETPFTTMAERTTATAVFHE